MSTNPPFSIGQKVVSLINSASVKKGDIFTVLGIKIHCCTKWVIDIGLTSPINLTLSCNDCKSLMRLVQNEPMWPEAICFGPIISDQYSESVSKELALEAMKDTIETDVVKIKEPGIAEKLN